MSEDKPAPPQDDVGSTDTTSPEPGATEQVEQENEAPSANKEAQRYRQELRSVEAERDRLRQQVEQLQRGEVERQLGEDVETPADIWMTGVQVGELLDDDGAVDASKVKQLRRDVLAQHPGWIRRPQPSVDTEQGQHSDHDTGPSWTSLLRAQGGS